MIPVHEVSQKYRETCDNLVLDSSIKNEDISNVDVLDEACNMNADAAVLADVWHDVDATVEAIIDGIEIYQSHECDCDLIIPLQPPHDECFLKLRDRGIDDNYTFAIGGVKDSSAEKKIESARTLRKVAGNDVKIHGLGFGVTDKLAVALHQNPNLLDSLDSSTPVQNSISETVEGDERLSIVAVQAGAKLLEDIRKLSSLTEPPTVPTQLEDF